MKVSLPVGHAARSMLRSLGVRVSAVGFGSARLRFGESSDIVAQLSELEALFAHFVRPIYAAILTGTPDNYSALRPAVGWCR